MSVSGNARRVPTDRHPKIDDRRPKPVGMAIITEPEVGAIQCSCGGFTAVHRRGAVRERKAQRHLDKHHDGQGIWL